MKGRRNEWEVCVIEAQELPTSKFGKPQWRFVATLLTPDEPVTIAETPTIHTYATSDAMRRLHQLIARLACEGWEPMPVQSQSQDTYHNLGIDIAWYFKRLKSNSKVT